MPLIERVLDRTACDTLDRYAQRGGGLGLETARGLGPSALIDEVHAAGLRGRGGAGFPTGVKWRTVAAASGQRPVPVVVNAAEGEPATFKDRALLRVNPFKVVEGALIAAIAMRATEVIIALKATFVPETARLRDVIEAMRRAGWTSGVDVRLVSGPSEYLFGEETALLEVVEGGQPFPRVTPPYRRGVDLPDADGSTRGEVLVDNVETLANVPGIVAHGANWFRSAGTADSPGTLVCTMTGHCRRHAVGEVPMGTPLREAIELIGGGAADGRRVVAAMSGVANPIIPERLLDTPLSYEAMERVGSGLGTGGYFVFDDQTDAVAVAAAVARFLAVESCGQCEPCKRDGLAIADRLRSISESAATQRDLDELPGLVATVADGARCFLAFQQQRVVQSALQLFPNVFTAHVDAAVAAAPVEMVVPITDIVGDRAVLETSHRDKQPDWTYDEVDSGAWPAAALGNAPVDVRPPKQPDVPDGASASIAAGQPARPDPLQPLFDMHAAIRRALDRLATADDSSIDAAADELRARLRLRDDVTRRVVHPMAARVASAPADDATWRAERAQAAASRLLDALDGVAANQPGADRSVKAIASELRDVVDRDEAQIVDLLRSHMDVGDLRELGDAIHEAYATSVGTPPATPASGAGRGTGQAPVARGRD